MTTRIVMNNGESLGDVLAQNLSDARTFLVATAYLNANGLSRVMPAVERILDGNGQVSVVHGFYPQITETHTVRDLARLADGFDQMRYGVYTDLDRSLEGSFHPKIYMTHSPANDWRVVIGSSNLTKGGLSSNLEVNCTLTGSASHPAIRQCRTVFDRIQKDQNMHRPSIEWIDAYDHIRDLKLRNRTRFQDETKEAYAKLFEITQKPSWIAKTRVECVIKALQNLEDISGRGTYHHLDEITAEAWRIARGRFQEPHWAAGVRQALNTNTIYREGGSKKLFEREDGDKGKSGRYRLSDDGRRYRRANV